MLNNNIVSLFTCAGARTDSSYDHVLSMVHSGGLLSYQDNLFLFPVLLFIYFYAFALLSMTFLTTSPPIQILTRVQCSVLTVEHFLILK